MTNGFKVHDNCSSQREEHTKEGYKTNKRLGLATTNNTSNGCQTVVWELIQRNRVCRTTELSKNW